MRLHARALLRSLRLIAAIASAAAVGFAATPAGAQTSWIDATGSWFTSGNWNAGVPNGATPTTTVGNGGTAQINGAAANAGNNLVINGGSTVDLQSGGSLVATAITIGPNGTLLLSGSSAVTGPIVMNGGSLISNVTATLTNSITTTAGFSPTFGAAAGNTLTLGGTTLQVLGGAGTTVHFGSATNTGTVVLAEAPNTAVVPSTAGAVDGGTLKVGNNLTANLILNMQGGFTVGSGTTPATLDVNGTLGGVTNLTGTSAGTITNSGAATTLVTFNSANSAFAGVIQDGADALALHVTGTGGTTLTLTGANTFSGGTTIDAGQTLQLGNGGTTGSIVGNVTDNGTLTFNRSDTATFAGAISSVGSLQQNGTGTTILTGINTYGGTTTINAGTLEVDGSITNSSSVTVNSGGTLSGNGTVDPPTTTIMSGGTLKPGNAANPTGTLTITGNLAFQSGAIYLVQITPTAAASTNVGGTASLAGTAQIVFLPGGFAKKSYDILHAAGGLGGTTFSGLTLSNPNFGGNLSYTATDAFFNLTSASLGAGTTLNQNQQNVANALNNFVNSGGTLTASFGPVFGLTGGALANALTQLDGEVGTGAERAAFQLDNQFLQLMLDPFVNGRGNPALGGTALGFAPEQEANLPPDIALAYASILTKAPPQSFEQRWTAWGSAYGGTSTTNGDPVVGSNNVRASTFGFAGGMDYHFTPNTVAGFALAGAGTNWGLANALGTGRSDALQVGAYGSHWFGPAYVAGALAFSNHWFSTSRSALGDQLNATFTGQNFGARLEGGYRYAVRPAFAVTPYGAVQAQTFHTPAYSETDVTGGGFGLNNAAMNATDVRTELGARFDDPTIVYNKPLILFGRLAWAHDFVSNPALSAAFQALPGGAFTVNGAPIPHDSALTTAGAQLFLTPQWTLLAKFEGEFARSSQTYAGTGTLRYAW
jgi:autotransporter-associated beta strand protein